MLAYIPFFKVIVVAVDVFESTIIDERHFSNRPEAEAFANEYRCSGGGEGTGYCPSDVTIHKFKHYIVGAALFRGSI